MRVLIVNKFYFLFGGTERYLFNLTDVLESKGHSVIPFAMQDERNCDSPYSDFFVSNVDLSATRKRTLVSELRRAGRILYSFEGRRKLKALISASSPNIAHIRNVYHQLSPSILSVLKQSGVPSVLTIADYKLICPSYSLFADGQICEACKNGRYYQAVLKRCVRDSFWGSALLALETTLHQTILDSYRKNVDLFISPSNFLKEKMSQFGFPGDRIVHLPHFCDSSKFTPGLEADDYAVFFGRIDHRKGLRIAIEAIRQSPLKLVIVGDGPEKQNLEREFVGESAGKVAFLGYKSREDLCRIIGHARFSLLPSQSYETFGHTVLESFACAKPVIASRIGAIPEIVDEGETGLLFEPGNVGDLCEKIAMLCRAPARTAEMGRRARNLVQEKYGPEEHYEKLMAIYQEVAR